MKANSSVRARVRIKDKNKSDVDYFIRSRLQKWFSYDINIEHYSYSAVFSNKKYDPHMEIPHSKVNSISIDSYNELGAVYFNDYQDIDLKLLRVLFNTDNSNNVINPELYTEDLPFVNSKSKCYYIFILDIYELGVFYFPVLNSYSQKESPYSNVKVHIDFDDLLFLSNTCPNYVLSVLNENKLNKLFWITVRNIFISYNNYTPKENIDNLIADVIDDIYRKHKTLSRLVEVF